MSTTPLRRRGCVVLCLLNVMLLHVCEATYELDLKHFSKETVLANFQDVCDPVDCTVAVLPDVHDMQTCQYDDTVTSVHSFLTYPVQRFYSVLTRTVFDPDGDQLQKVNHTQLHMFNDTYSATNPIWAADSLWVPEDIGCDKHLSVVSYCRKDISQCRIYAVDWRWPQHPQMILTLPRCSHGTPLLSLEPTSAGYALVSVFTPCNSTRILKLLDTPQPPLRVEQMLDRAPSLEYGRGMSASVMYTTPMVWDLRCSPAACTGKNLRDPPLLWLYDSLNITNPAAHAVNYLISVDGATGLEYTSFRLQPNESRLVPCAGMEPLIVEALSAVSVYVYTSQNDMLVFPIRMYPISHTVNTLSAKPRYLASSNDTLSLSPLIQSNKFMVFGSVSGSAMTSVAQSNCHTYWNELLAFTQGAYGSQLLNKTSFRDMVLYNTLNLGSAKDVFSPDQLQIQFSLVDRNGDNYLDVDEIRSHCNVTSHLYFPHGTITADPSTGAFFTSRGPFSVVLAQNLTVCAHTACGHLAARPALNDVCNTSPALGWLDCFGEAPSLNIAFNGDTYGATTTADFPRLSLYTLNATVTVAASWYLVIIRVSVDYGNMQSPVVNVAMQSILSSVPAALFFRGRRMKRDMLVTVPLSTKNNEVEFIVVRVPGCAIGEGIAANGTCVRCRGDQASLSTLPYGFTVCTVCPVGKEVAGSNSQCSPCSAGSARQTSPFCEKCPQGTAQPYVTFGQLSWNQKCVPCPGGTYGTHPGTYGPCSPCPKPHQCAAGQSTFRSLGPVVIEDPGLDLSQPVIPSSQQARPARYAVYWIAFFVIGMLALTGVVAYHKRPHEKLGALLLQKFDVLHNMVSKLKRHSEADQNGIAPPKRMVGALMTILFACGCTTLIVYEITRFYVDNYSVHILPTQYQDSSEHASYAPLRRATIAQDMALEVTLLGWRGPCRMTSVSANVEMSQNANRQFNITQVRTVSPEEDAVYYGCLIEASIGSVRDTNGVEQQESFQIRVNQQFVFAQGFKLKLSYRGVNTAKRSGVTVVRLPARGHVACETATLSLSDTISILADDGSGVSQSGHSITVSDPLTRVQSCNFTAEGAPPVLPVSMQLEVVLVHTEFFFLGKVEQNQSFQQLALFLVTSVGGLWSALVLMQLMSDTGYDYTVVLLRKRRETIAMREETANQIALNSTKNLGEPLLDRSETPSASEDSQL